MTRPAVLAALLLVSCAEGEEPARPDLLEFLPPESNLVLMVDFQEVVHGPLGILFYRERPPLKPGEAESPFRVLERETGFEVGRDLWRLAFAVEWGPWGPQRFAGLFEGRFDSGSLREWLARRSPGETSYHGRDLLSFPLPVRGGAGEDGHLGFLGDRLAVVGDPESVARVIDLSDGMDRGIMGSSRWSGPLDRVDREAGIWAVLASPSLFAGWAAVLQDQWPRFDLGEPLSRLRGVTLEADVSAGISVVGLGFLDSPVEAESLLDALRAAIALLRIEFGEKNLPLRSLLDSIRAEATEGGIRVRFQVPLDLIEDFRWDFPKFPRIGRLGEDPRPTIAVPLRIGQAGGFSGVDPVRSTSDSPISPATRMLFRSR